MPAQLPHWVVGNTRNQSAQCTNLDTAEDLSVVVPAQCVQSHKEPASHFQNTEKYVCAFF